MEYVKTQGTGFGFTDSKSEAMRFESRQQVDRMRDRLSSQFSNYSWEIVSDDTYFYLVTHRNS